MDWHKLTSMPHWLARPGSELDKLRRAAVSYWQKLESMLAWPAAQLDPMTAELALVHLLAWERNITPIPGEQEQMFRLRVKYALTFAKGAGSTRGWLNMFNKLGFSWVAISERESVINWDLVTLQITDADLAGNSRLLLELMRQYGRTCRRYRVAVSFSADTAIEHACFGHSLGVYSASAFNQQRLVTEPNELTHNHQIFSASLEINQ